MPLPEHEQKILADLEESHFEQDPWFVGMFNADNVFSFEGRWAWWVSSLARPS